MTPTTNMPRMGDTLVSARFQIVQSKRLLLSVVERRLRDGDESLLARAERLRSEIEDAHQAYQRVVLTWARPDSREYWMVAYGSLIGLAETLVEDLRDTISDLPAGQRFEVATEIEMLENLLDRWREIQRVSMALGAA